MTGMQYYPLTGFFLWNCPKPRMNEHFKKKRMKFILHMVSFLNFFSLRLSKEMIKRWWLGISKYQTPNRSTGQGMSWRTFPRKKSTWSYQTNNFSRCIRFLKLHVAVLVLHGSLMAKLHCAYCSFWSRIWKRVEGCRRDSSPGPMDEDEDEDENTPKKAAEWPSSEARKMSS